MSVMEIITIGALIVLALVDIRKKMIPVMPVVLLGIALLLGRICSGISVLELLCGMIPGIILLTFAVLSKGGIGMGDGIVLCVVGIACGAERTVAILGISLVLAALWAIILLIIRRANRKTELPFLPCMLAGYILGVWIV